MSSQVARVSFASALCAAAFTHTPNTANSARRDGSHKRPRGCAVGALSVRAMAARAAAALATAGAAEATADDATDSGDGARDGCGASDSQPRAAGPAVWRERRQQRAAHRAVRAAAATAARRSARAVTAAALVELRCARDGGVNRCVPIRKRVRVGERACAMLVQEVLCASGS